MSALFITATGTDIGKTFVAAGLIAELKRRKREVAALKPIATGFEEWSAPASDPARLLDALDLPASVEEIARIAPFRFRAPMAPDSAARREGRHLALAEVVSFCKAEAEACAGTLIIEGIGGAMVPIDERHTVLDWIAELHAPALLVAGNYLGTISHTLTALAALRHRRIEVAAIVVSESRESDVPIDENVAEIRRFSHGVPVLPLPQLHHGAHHPTFDALADLCQ